MSEKGNSSPEHGLSPALPSPVVEAVVHILEPYD